MNSYEQIMEELMEIKAQMELEEIWDCDMMEAIEPDYPRQSIESFELGQMIDQY